MKLSTTFVACGLGLVSGVAGFGVFNDGDAATTSGDNSDSGSGSDDEPTTSDGTECVAGGCTSCDSGDCCWMEDWDVCLDNCGVGGSTDCISCIFEAGFTFGVSECPDDCVSHPEGYCGQECGSEYGGSNSQFGCYFCFSEAECLDGGCKWSYSDSDDEYECQPPCSPDECGNCDSADECNNETDGMCNWRDEESSCEESCAAGNCHMCGEGECGESNDCVWDQDSGEWVENCYEDAAGETVCEGYNVGECRDSCSSNNCWSCQADLYGLEDNSAEAIALCEDNGCFFDSDYHCYMSTEYDETTGESYDVEICDGVCTAPCVDPEGEVNCQACSDSECEDHGCMFIDTNIVNGIQCHEEPSYECYAPCGSGDDWDSDDNEGQARPNCWNCAYLGNVADTCADGCNLEDHGAHDCEGNEVMNCSD